MTLTPSSDCWGRLNDVPDVTPIVTMLDTLPDGFRQARQTMLRHLGLSAASQVFEGGSGPGTALADLLEWVGPSGRIVGIDPTRSLVAHAEERAAQLGAPHATYAEGDIRNIAQADGRFDAAFCDKILVHVGPASQAVSELVRITRRGGRVGAVEWYSQGMAMAADYTLTRQVLDGSAPAGALNPMLPLELETLWSDAGLEQIESGAVVAESRRFLPSLQMMLQRRVQQAVELGAMTTDAGTRWLEDLRSREANGRFYWAATVRWVAGTKPALP